MRRGEGKENRGARGEREEVRGQATRAAGGKWTDVLQDGVEE